MPVDDVVVHEKTKVGADYRSGCHSMYGNQRVSGYWAKDGFRFDELSESELVSTQRWIWVEDTSSQHCRQTLYASLPFCEGCTREKDTEYLEKWK